MLKYIYLSSFFLFVQVSQHHRRYFPPHKTYPPAIQKFLTNKINALKLPKGYRSLMRALFLGKKRGISAPLKKRLTRYNLLHLLTPSGLHVGALLLPLMYLLRKKRWWLLPLFFYLLLGSHGHFSLERICLMKILWCFRVPLKINFFSSFAIAILIGNFENSPLSFCMSYLFLGTLIATRSAAGYKKIAALGGAQLLVAYFLNQEFFPVSATLGILFTPFFGPIFIALLVALLAGSPSSVALVFKIFKV